MDYRLLLLKYINHVAACEGTTFIDDLPANLFSFGVTFTQKEVDELVKLDKETYP